MDEEDIAFHKREDFWLKAASWTFGLWAIMIPITGRMILDGQDKIREGQEVLAERFQTYKEFNGTAMAVMKERQDSIVIKQREIELDVRNLKEKIIEH